MPVHTLHYHLPFWAVAQIEWLELFHQIPSAMLIAMSIKTDQQPKKWSKIYMYKLWTERCSTHFFQSTYRCLLSDAMSVASMSFAFASSSFFSAGALLLCSAQSHQSQRPRSELQLLAKMTSLEMDCMVNSTSSLWLTLAGSVLRSFGASRPRQ